MRPHTHTHPKVLLQVAGKPMLNHIIDDLVAAGIDGITFIVGYLGDRIEEHVRKHYSNLDLHFIEQEQMLGLGHAIALAKDIHKDDKELLIILGDTIVKADFRKMFALGTSALAVMPVDDPRRFGTVQLDDSNKRITGLLEKAENPPTNLAIVGVYMIDNPALMFEGLDHIIDNDIRTKNEFQLTDALSYMLDKGDVMQAFEIKDWLDCGNPETLLETNAKLLKEQGDSRAEEYRKLYPSCVFISPVYIGENCELENSVIGPNVSMRFNVTVKHAILSDCTIGKESYLEKTILYNSMVGEFATVQGVNGSLNVGDHSALTRD